MLDKTNFAVGTIVGAVAFILFIGVIASCADRSDERYKALFVTCVQAGGSWIPTSAGNALCINKGTLSTP